MDGYHGRYLPANHANNREWQFASGHFFIRVYSRDSRAKGILTVTSQAQVFLCGRDQIALCRMYPDRTLPNVDPTD